MRITKKGSSLVMLLAVLAILGSCERDKPDKTRLGDVQSPSAASPVPAAEAPRRENGAILVTYLTGKVVAIREAGDRSLGIGDELTVEDTVLTESGGACDIQFGDTATVRIRTKTRLAIRDFAEMEGETKVGLRLDAGTILCKVNKLAAKDRFEVRTATALCGVRGTEFLVDAVGNERTRVAVKKGKVAVLPASLDPVAALGPAAADSVAQAVSAALDEYFMAAAPLVEANAEITMSSAQSKKAQGVAEALREAVAANVAASAKAASSGPASPAASSSPALQAELQAKVPAIVKAPTAASESSRRELEELDALRIIAVPASEGAQAGAEVAAGAVAAMARISVVATPPEAEILFDGHVAGVGAAGGLYPVGSRLRVEAHSPGYVPWSQDIEVVDEKARDIPISLSREQDSRKPEASTAAAATAPARVLRTIVIVAKPAEAAIAVDGKAVGKGSCAMQVAPGMSLSVSASCKGYATRETAVAVAEDGPAQVEIALEATAIYDRYKIGTAAIVGLAAGEDGGIYASDAAGALTAIDREGRRLWSAATSNSPNELGIPVVMGDLVCLSGGKELVLCAAKDGGVRKRIELGKEKSHLFGNRAIGLGDRIATPTSASIDLLDREGSPLRSIALADGTLATPARWKESLVVLGQKGAISIIDPDSGTETRKIPTKATQPVAAAPLVLGDTAYFSDRKGLVFAVDLQGATKWSRPATGEGSGAYADLASGGGGIYGLFKQSVAGLAASDGHALFEPIKGASTPPAITSAGLAFGVLEGGLAICDPKSGSRIKAIPLGAKPTSRPLELAGGLIATGTASGEVVVANPRGQ